MGKSFGKPEVNELNNETQQALEKAFPHLVTLNGSVPIKIGDVEVVSLTGSATVYEVGGKRYLIDLGMFQGGEGSDVFNQENTAFLKDIDAVIVTHAHIDHIGRLPILYKMGYRGDIYMTHTTSKITREMLLDSHKIQTSEIEANVKRHDTLGDRLKKALKIKSKLSEGNQLLSERERFQKKKFIQHTFGNNFDKNSILKENQDYLDFFEVSTESDIAKVLEKLKRENFTKDDIDGVIRLVQTLEVGEERVLHHKNYKPSNLLNDLPLRVAEGFDEKIIISHRTEKKELVKKWEQQLLDAKIKSLENFEEDAIKYLETAFQHVENVKLRGEIKRGNYDGPEYKDYCKLLKTLGITHRKEIKHKIHDKQKLLEALEIHEDSFKIPFNSIDLQNAKNLLYIDSQLGDDKDMIGISFIEAAHIAGSSSVVFTSGKIKKKVEDVIDIDGETKVAYFSGDLGRGDFNRVGNPEKPGVNCAPEIPIEPVDYLQIETTYGGREHKNRKESVEELISSIHNSKGNVLISGFAQQRIQEILQTLLEEILKGDHNLLNYEILVDAPLAQAVNSIYIRHENDIYPLIDPQTQREVFGQEMFRFLEQGEYEEIHSEYLYKKMILSDSVSEKVHSNVLSHHRPKTLFAPKIIDADEIKGKTIINLKFPKKINSKKIIIASSGMIDGGAIMNHLKYILPDNYATLLAPGYQAHGTLGHEIVINKANKVCVGDEDLPVKCDSKFIDGFSSHISHNDILSFIWKCLEQGKLKKNSTIALNHGSRNAQEALKIDLLDHLKHWGRKDISITMPEIFEPYNIDTKKSLPISIENDLLKENTTKKKRQEKTPAHLTNEEKQAEKERKKEVVTPKHNKELQRNNIFQVHQLSQKIHYSRQFLDIQPYKYVKQVLTNNRFSLWGKLKNDILGLSPAQKKSLKAEIQLRRTQKRDQKSKLSQLISEKKKISNFVKEIDTIEEMYGFIQSFFLYQKPNIDKQLIQLNDVLIQLKEKEYELKTSFETIQTNALTSLKKDSYDYKKYQEQIDKISKKIRKTHDNINKLEETLDTTLITLRRSCYSIDSNEVKQYILKDIKILESNNQTDIGGMSGLNNMIQERGNSIDIEINGLQNLLHTQNSFVFEKLDIDESKKIIAKKLKLDDSTLDLELIQTGLDQGLFDNEQSRFVSRALSKAKGTVTTKKVQHELRRYLRQEFKVGEREGIDLTIDVSGIRKDLLTTFSEIFNQDYYEKVISPNFDIYLFLRMGGSIEKYIIEKYQIAELKGYDNYFTKQQNINSIHGSIVPASYSDLKKRLTLIQNDIDSYETEINNNNIDDISFLKMSIMESKTEASEIHYQLQQLGKIK